MRSLRVLAPGFAVLFVFVLVAACGGDDSGNSGNSGTAPSSCPAEPCTVGDICYQPAPTENCNGAWYCWSDQKWYCAPPDAGGPGDATVNYDGPYPGDENGDPEPGDGATEAAPVDAGPTADAGPG